jgi:hypothetical protein
LTIQRCGRKFILFSRNGSAKVMKNNSYNLDSCVRRKAHKPIRQLALVNHPIQVSSRCGAIRVGVFSVQIRHSSNRRAESEPTTVARNGSVASGRFLNSLRSVKPGGMASPGELRVGSMPAQFTTSVNRRNQDCLIRGKARPQPFIGACVPE